MSSDEAEEGGGAPPPGASSDEEEREDEDGSEGGGESDGSGDGDDDDDGSADDDRGDGSDDDDDDDDDGSDSGEEDGSDDEDGDDSYGGSGAEDGGGSGSTAGPTCAADTIRGRKRKADDADGGDENDGSGSGSDSDSSSSDSSSSSDDSDDDDDDDAEPTATDSSGRKLSAYELLRLERIKRNKAKLAALGLEGDSSAGGGGRGGRPSTLLGPYAAEMERKKREKLEERRKGAAAAAAAAKEEEEVVQRRLPSRSTKANVNYTEVPTWGVSKERDKDEERDREREKEKEKEKKERRKLARPAAPADDWKKNLGRRGNDRMPLVVYREFKRMEIDQRTALKTAERELRSAETEHRHARKNADIYLRKARKREEQERRRREMEEAEEERNALAGLFRELDIKKREVYQARAQYDWAKQKKIAEAQRRETQRRVAVLESLKRFPQIVAEAERSLDAALLDRCPSEDDEGDPNLSSVGIVKGRAKRVKMAAAAAAAAQNGGGGAVGPGTAAGAAPAHAGVRVPAPSAPLAYDPPPPPPPPPAFFGSGPFESPLAAPRVPAYYAPHGGDGGGGDPHPYGGGGGPYGGGGGGGGGVHDRGTPPAVGPARPPSPGAASPAATSPRFGGGAVVPESAPPSAPSSPPKGPDAPPLPTPEGVGKGGAESPGDAPASASSAVPAPPPPPSASRTKRAKVRNVGGPVSGEYAACVRRGWLSGDVPVAPSGEDVTVPQVGDVVLYYPSGHRSFLESHPDTLGAKTKSKFRVPLWERVKLRRRGGGGGGGGGRGRGGGGGGEKGEERGEGADPDPDAGPPEAEAPTSAELRGDAAEPSKKSPKPTWWTEDWISGVRDGTWNYPILCRVEAAHAEFPYDPPVKKKRAEKKKRERKEKVEEGGTGGGEAPAKKRKAERAPEKAPKKKAKRRKKAQNRTDWLAPKKPMSAFFLFSKDKRAEIMAKHPGDSFGHISKHVGAEYKSLSHAAKREWEERAKAESEQHGLLRVRVKLDGGDGDGDDSGGEDGDGGDGDGGDGDGGGGDNGREDGGGEEVLTAKIPHTDRKRRADDDGEGLKVTVRLDGSAFCRPLIAVLPGAEGEEEGEGENGDGDRDAGPAESGGEAISAVAGAEIPEPPVTPEKVPSNGAEGAEESPEKAEEGEETPERAEESPEKAEEGEETPERAEGSSKGAETPETAEEPSPSQSQSPPQPSPQRGGEPNPPLRLAVTLKPLTPVLPPPLDGGTAGGRDDELRLPPVFSAAIFPSQNPPFLVPFAWAYASSLALAEGDRVSLPFDDASYEGTVTGVYGGMAGAGGDLWGSMDLFPDVFGRGGAGPAGGSGGRPNLAALGDRLGQILRCAAGEKSAARVIPMKDLRAVVWAIYCHFQGALSGGGNGAPGRGPPQSKGGEDGGGASEAGPSSSAPLIKFIRATFPLWDGIIIRWDDGSECSVNGWELTKVLPPAAAVSSPSGASAPPQQPPPLSDRFHGLVSSLDESLRAKIELVLQAYIKKTPEANSFVPPVTEDVAPGYGRVVPIGMSFRRILKRIKRHPLKRPRLQQPRAGETNQDLKVELHCYYRSVGSILADLSEIHHCCLLYNDPSSAIAKVALDVVGMAKDLILEIESSYRRDRRIKERQAQHHPTLLLHPDALSPKQSNVPFKGNLCRGWAQSALRDESWGEAEDGPSAGRTRERPAPNVPTNGQPVGEVPQSATSVGGAPPSSAAISAAPAAHENGRVRWVPQAGDRILYSPSRHRKFVRGHSLSLTPEQIALPPVLPPPCARRAYANEGGCVGGVLTGGEGSADEFKGWMAGAVLWLRATFPDENAGSATFDELTPLFTMGVQFHYTWASRNVHLLHWRPCCVREALGSSPHPVPMPVTAVVDEAGNPKAGSPSACQVQKPGLADEGKGETANLTVADAEQSKQAENKAAPQTMVPLPSSPVPKAAESTRCLSCGLDQSFLQPAWISTGQEPILTPTPQALTACPPPSGLSSDKSKGVDECLEVLKVRAAEDILPDALGKNPQTRRVAHQHILDASVSPALSFGEMLVDAEACDAENGGEGRGVVETRRGGDKAVQRVRVALAAMHFLPPWLSSGGSEQPNKKGAKAKGMDKQKRPKRPKHETLMPLPDLCLELVHRRLRNGHYRQVSGAICDIREAYVASVLYLLASQRVKPMKKIARLVQKQADLTSDGRMVPYDIQSNVENGPGGAATKKEQHRSKKEMHLVAHIQSVRKLYATAVVCFTDTSAALTAFGRKRNQAQEKRPGLQAVIQEQQRAVARRNVDLLLSALAHDPCSVRRPLGSNHSYPVVRVKIDLKDAASPGGAVVGPGPKASSVLCAGATEAANPSGAVDEEVPLKPENEQSHNADTEGADERQSNSSHIAESEEEDVDADSEVVSIVDTSQPIVFESRVYEADLDLVRTFFGQYDRMDACARCKLAKRSMLNCRVRRAHSNADFDWNECVDRFGGIDGLLRLLDPSSPIRKPLPASDQMCTSVKSAGVGAEAQADISGEAKIGGDDTTQLAAKNEAPTETEAKPGSHDASKAATEKEPIPAAVQPDPADDDGKSALEILRKAETALQMARDALEKEKASTTTRPLLSKEFVKQNFPMDTDGHYLYCLICGLSGDVLCCEKCPVVAHIACVSLAAVPEGDWFCGQCDYFVDSKGEDVVTDSHKQDPQANEPEHLNTPPLTVLLEELRSMRLETKPEKGKSTVQDEPKCNAVETDETGEKGHPTAVETDEKGSHTAVETGEKGSLTAVENDAPTAVETNEKGSPEQNKNYGKGASSGDKNPPAVIGTKMMKNFRGLGDFEGVVIRIPSGDFPFYRALYEDGDVEDYTDKEIRRYVAKWEKAQETKNLSATKRNASKGTGRKRGRPPKKQTQTESTANAVKSSKTSGSQKQLAPTSTDAKLVSSSLKPETPRRRRGRPPKKRLLKEGSVGGEESLRTPGSSQRERLNEGQSESLATESGTPKQMHKTCSAQE